MGEENKFVGFKGLGGFIWEEGGGLLLCFLYGRDVANF